MVLSGERFSHGNLKTRVRFFLHLCLVLWLNFGKWENHFKKCVVHSALVSTCIGKLGKKIGVDTHTQT